MRDVIGVRGKLGRFLVVLCALIVGADVAVASTTIDFSGWVRARDEALIEAFMAERSDITVEWRNQAGNETLIVQIAAGGAPDVMTISWASVGDFMRAGLLEDLGPWIKADEREIAPNDIFPAALASGVWNNVQYSLPAVLGAQGLYLNVDLLQQAGLGVPEEDWSWDTFATMAKRLTRVDSAGNTVQWGWHRTTDYAAWMSVIFSYGGTVLSPGFGTPAFNSPETVAGLSMLQKMVYEDRVDGGAFAKGTAAMVIRPSETVLTWLAKANFEWQGFLLPRGPARRALMGGAHQLAMNKDSKKKTAAWEFMKFYTGKAGQQVVTQVSGSVPLRQSLLRAAIERNPDLAVLVRQMDVWTQYTNRLHNEINRIWSPVINQLYAGGVSPQEAAMTIQEQLLAIW